MARPNLLRALPKVWFRFTDEEDQGKYGAAWYCYDETAIMNLRGRDLVELENALGIPLPSAMNGFRQSTTLGDMAVTWMAIHRTDPARAGDFDEYNPVTNAIEWSSDEPESEGKGDAPAPTPGQPESNSTTPEASLSPTSVTTATVVLPVLPVAE